MHPRVAIDAVPAYCDLVVVVVKLTLTTFDVAAYARYRRTCHEKLVVYRAVRSVTNRTTLAHCFMLENERASLFFVALEAFFILSQQTTTQ